MGGEVFNVIGIAILVLIAIISIYIFLIYGEKVPEKQCKWLKTRDFAHRGLYTMDQTVPENSIKAFQKAIDSNYGIELDVAFTKDKRTVVFHDDNLFRMTGLNKDIRECTLKEVESLTLKNTDSKIPLFKDVLKFIDGKVPLIIEIKTCKDRDGICDAVYKELQGYKGDFCIESFDPLIINRIKKLMPNVIRGQLSMNYRNSKTPILILRFALQNLLLNFKSRPNFIAYNWEDRNNLSFKILKKMGIITVAWTVNSEDALRICRNEFDTIIFEYCKPQ